MLTKSQRKHVKEALTAYGFLAPALTILIVFGLFPVGYALYVSMHRWRFRKGDFIGLAQYARALGESHFLGHFLAGIVLLIGAGVLWRKFKSKNNGIQWKIGLLWLLSLVGGIWLVGKGAMGILDTGDSVFLNGLKVTTFYAIGSIPLQLGISLILAYILFQNIRGKSVFRTFFFLPYVTPMIASAVVFRSIFNPRASSIANRVLDWIGIAPQRWLFEDDSIVMLILKSIGIQSVPGWVNVAFPSMALASVILYNIWVYVGYDTVIFLAGLSAIPKEYYEAAKIDGAGYWSQFRHITVPLLSPTTFFLSMVAVIGTFKAFNHIYIMRLPGARGTIDTASIVIFDAFFKSGQAGYASAMGLVLFGVILSLTMMQNRLLGRKVFYK